MAWDELHDAELACKSLAALDADEALRTDDRERYAAALAERGQFKDALEQRVAALREIGELATAAAWLEIARELLDKLDAPARAREACDRALAREPKNRAALALRADLFGKLCEPAREFEDVLALAELESEPAVAAATFTRAGELARDRLGDPMRAWALFRTALKKDNAHLPALLGAGAIALARQEWAEAERSYGLAASLLRGSADDEKLGQVARAAAQAAQAQERFAGGVPLSRARARARAEPPRGARLDGRPRAAPGRVRAGARLPRRAAARDGPVARGARRPAREAGAGL